jgi:hypothetical protein
MMRWALFGLEMPPLRATMSESSQVFDRKLILIMANAAAGIQSGDKKPVRERRHEYPGKEPIS